MSLNKIISMIVAVALIVLDGILLLMDLNSTWKRRTDEIHKIYALLAVCKELFFLSNF